MEVGIVKKNIFQVGNLLKNSNGFHEIMVLCVEEPKVYEGHGGSLWELPIDNPVPTAEFKLAFKSIVLYDERDSETCYVFAKGKPVTLSVDYGVGWKLA